MHVFSKLRPAGVSLCRQAGSRAFHSSGTGSKFTAMLDSVWAQESLFRFKPPKGFEKFRLGRGKAKETKSENKGQEKPKLEQEQPFDKSSKKPDDGKGPNGDPKGPQVQINMTTVATAAAALFLFSLANRSNIVEMPFHEFQTELLLKGYAEKLLIVTKQNTNNHEVTVHVRPDAPAPYSGNVYRTKIGSIDHFENQLETIQNNLNIPREAWIPVEYQTAPEYGFDELLLRSLPFAVMLLLPFLLVRGAFKDVDALMSGGKNNSNPLNRILSISKVSANESKPTVTFADVAGLKQAKQEVMEFVEFLKDPSKFQALGAKIPKGALLVGPPGTGKTLLAKAVAGEASVPFYSVSGSDFVEMFVGVGPARVRNLFQKAREKAPSIVFIDEIDAVGRKRGQGNGGSDERENTLNQMLVEMDGFSSSTGVVVLAGTNRSDILDSALLRPGRFDRQIGVDKPDLNEREEIFHVHLKPITVSKSVTRDELAKRLSALTPGMTGADIANLCNEAAIFAARRGGNAVKSNDFERAAERVLAGLPKSNKLMSDKEKNTIAIHESGHAVAGWFLEHADPLLKVTIVPRSSGALGFAQYLPSEVGLLSREALLDKICTTLAGRAAEDVFVGRISTGAADDFDKVTRMAYGMVQVYGMSDTLGHVSWNPEQMSQAAYKPFSEATALKIDQEVKKLIDEQYKRAKQLLKDNEALVKSLSKALFDKETVVYNDLKEILGPRPHALPENYEKFIDTSLAAPRPEELDEPEERPEPEDPEKDVADLEHKTQTAVG